ncbi:MAG: pyridoxamine 5'-phosphate oxidase family protein [Acidimicrobiia bacterium]|nr:pyridoxamine 5'-phosphate oxidase family protein [Acidimicrobiia bacterium]
MSVPVATDALAEQLDRYGRVAFLLTVSPDQRPHSVSVSVTFTDGELRAAVGGTSATNAEASGRVTLLWPSRPVDPGYSLIVDGEARVERDGDGARIAVTPTRAVQHRQADADRSAPNCIPVEAP